MPRRTPALVTLMLASWLAACHAPTTARAPGKTTLGAGGTTQLSKAAGGQGLVGGSVHAAATPAGISSLTPLGGSSSAPLVAARLAGKVVAPASLLSNNGGSVVANNGGGVVANSGGGVVANNSGNLAGNRPTARRLFDAAGQVPVANATVSFTDATGAYLAGPDGKQLTATTDAQGTYQLAANLPARNLIAHVSLGTKGELQAVSLAPDATGSRPNTNLDLVSSLTTGYILGKYVSTQTDRQAALDRLTPGVERDTLAKTAAALAKDGVQVPDALTTDRITSTVDQLRGADKDLDAQWNVVRSLLVAAGQSNLGDGMVATQVGLGSVGGLAQVGATLYIACPQDQRIWKLGKDGILHTAVGVGYTADADIDGKAGNVVSINVPVQILADGDGLLILENTGRVSRLGADGKLQLLWSGPPVSDRYHPAVALAHPSASQIFVLTGGLLQRQSQPRPAPGSTGLPSSGMPHVRRLLSSLPPGVPTPRPRPTPHPAPSRATPPPPVYVVRTPIRVWQVGQSQPVYSFSDADTTALNGQLHAAARPDGKLRLVSWQGLKSLADDLDLSTFALTPVPFTARGSFGFDQNGELVPLDEVNATLQANASDDPYAYGLAAYPFSPVWQTANGDLLVGATQAVVHALGQQVTVVAGLSQLPRSGLDSTIAFQNLQLLAASHAGTLAVYDGGTHWLWQIGTDHQAHVVTEVPDNLASDSSAVQPLALRETDDGTIYLLDGAPGGNGIRLLTPDGQNGLKQAFIGQDRSADGGAVDAIQDATVDPQGHLVFLLQRTEADNTVHYVLQSQPGGVERPIDPPPTEGDFTEVDPTRVGIAPDGTVLLADASNPAIWTPGKPLVGITPPADGSAVTDFSSMGRDWNRNDTGELTVDARHRLWLTDNTSIWCFDPATYTMTTVVGDGGTAFQGTGVDNGISQGSTVLDPVLDGKGTLYFLDNQARQIKQLPLAQQP